jgi:multidrug efflux pump subunit AcrA (membrane-fusion protein)
MTVRRHVPWPLRAATLALAVAVGAAGGMWAWRALFDGAASERQRLSAEVVRLDARVAEESAERQRVAAIIVAAQNQLRIEQAAAERLEEQVKQLQAENAELKSDLAYLESLFPTADTQGPVAIRRFEVEPDGAEPNRMRYRALLMQAGRTERRFSGSLQLVVTMQGNAGTKMMTLPDDGPAQARERMKLSFRRVLRIEGHFQVPEGARLQSVRLRVLERGTLRAEQMASL